ncbi:MAG: M23 family metallopeptidase [Marinosulfonomonas sp.]|nr:M23 family metallopeptidase [Marinosulfonomonas sp.]
MRSDTETRFIRLTPTSQMIAWAGGITFVSWSIIATSFLLMDAIGSGSIREQAKREQKLYEMRLNDLSLERDTRATEARMARSRFNTALEQISSMQLALLASEDRRKEMEKGIEVIQFTLRRTIHERDAARTQVEVAQAGLGPNLSADQFTTSDPDLAATLDFLTAALDQTALQRDAISAKALHTEVYVAELELEQKLLFERNDRIFSQLEDAVSLSLAPLDKMFAASGMPTERILDTVRRGYSGQGGPLSPLTFSTRGQAPNPDSLRANGILEKMDRMNLYRIAADKMPFSLPVKSAFRHTSGFGPRWGRMHSGTDFAAAYGTPIYATADGVVVHAGWQTSYGRLIKIKHEFGLETRFAHLAQIRVKVGQKVSRGDRIGDMGSSGRSTGTHLHYEIRDGGKALNPMIYIKAANDVF